MVLRRQRTCTPTLDNKALISVSPFSEMTQERDELSIQVKRLEDELAGFEVRAAEWHSPPHVSLPGVPGGAAV